MASIIDQQPFTEHTGNGVSTVFAYEFQLLAASDLVVTIDNVVVPASEFILAGVGSQSGGTVDFNTAPLDQSNVLLSRELLLERDTDYQERGDLLSAVLDNDFNRIWQAMQGQRSEINGSLRFPFPEVAPPLPDAAARANTQLLFDSNGQPYVAAPISGSVADVLLQLADTTDPTKGAGMVGFNPPKNYVLDTIGWGVQLTGVQLEWFYEAADADDYIPAFNRAKDFLLLLIGPAHLASMDTPPFRYGTARVLNLAGKKYPIKSPAVLAGDISIMAHGGGFYANGAFPAAEFMVDTGADRYCGRINDMVVDGNDQNVKGVLIRDAHLTRWRGLSVINCKNDGIEYRSGAEFILDGFECTGAVVPSAITSVGLRIGSSDSMFMNGVIKYYPIGCKLEGGGNHELSKIHAWGLYDATQMYVGFWFVNSIRNTCVQLFSDSPAMQDYNQPNETIINGIPNGGIGFLVDVNSTQNKFIAPRTQDVYAGAGSSKRIGFDVSAQFTGIEAMNHNYAGNWLADIRYSTDAVRDSCLVLGSPGTANGIRPAVLENLANSGGGQTYFAVTNTSSSFASSAATTALRVGSAEVAALTGFFGPAGASYLSVIRAGTERLRIDPNKMVYTGGSNSAEGDLVAQWTDGLGSYHPMTLHRNAGGGVPNAAIACAKFGNMANGRSINAGGTVNASGADHAEYMTKAPACGTVAAGQIVGIDANGQITDLWAGAISFMVKSTNPSYVGGDNWADSLGPRPEAPQWRQPDLPPRPTQQEEVPAWDAAVRAIVEPLEAQYLADMAAFEEQQAAFNAAFEELRQTVDRIALNGQVPVNVMGATPGDYIVPVLVGADGIGGMAVAAPTFDQYRAAVGRVVAIEPDGRARVIVKVS